ncbi:outer membrane lipoprotein chaperone LolA [Aliidiomarina quisquiliarum]|uniref:outer membrane lipoprotein chaperone LolA n=1 Tax=Aliidiomarina quisquiliarum TaxID=2938947 RepID=UPI00208E437F|nr:outer membrane lipoprotein chaperone LolA [Aliidiomarina quisquiliarum]MCO4320788.1 outer membrane lipoprotein chaperone LolA [Aliidiomarina quisquiliarum]
MVLSTLFKKAAHSSVVRAVMATTFCVALITSPIAQANQAQSEPAPQAETLRALLANIQTLAGRFEQHIYENEEKVEVMQGIFALQRPSQLYWETESPDESVLVADGETVWYYNPFIEQVSLFAQSQTMASNPLLVLLESDAWDGFYIQFDQGRWIIDGQDEAQGQQLVLRFNSANLLVEMELSDAYGQRSVFMLSDLQENQPIAPKRFEFIVPDGVDIDDQRDY